MPSARQTMPTQLYSWHENHSDGSSVDSDDDSASSLSAASAIPRPCNSFILFRRKYSQEHSKQAGSTAEDDEKSLSRRAGDAWNALSQSEKRPWVMMAKREKEEHERKYPNYRFHPAKRPSSKSSKSTMRKHSKSMSAASQPQLRSTPLPLAARTQSPPEPRVYRPVARRATSDGTVNIVDGELRFLEEFSAPVLLYDPMPATAVSPSGYYDASYLNSSPILSSPGPSPTMHFSYSSPCLKNSAPWLSPVEPLFEQFGPALVPPQADYQQSYLLNPMEYTAPIDPSVWGGLFDGDEFASQPLPAF